MTSRIDEIRLAAEGSLEVFINLVHPQRVLGHCHREVIHWWTREDAKDHQLLLLPRDHGKSAMVAYRVAWEVTRNPAVRVLYISSTANLAEKQLKFIKDIFESKIYRRYWPDMINPLESQREKWTNTEISVDHPKRKAEYVRDPTIFTGGLTTVITGLHCDIAVLDDVIVNDNTYTAEGRQKVQTQYSFLASIEGTESREWVVGTRYHPEDLYHDMLEMSAEMFDPATGEMLESEKVYEVYERQVEDAGDGTGEYLWPRMQRQDGKWFGFDQKILSIKKAKYKDKTQFRAQYYNNPNDADSAPIKREYFQYYKKDNILRKDGVYYGSRKLNVFAAVDFAFSLKARADYSSIVVVGVDANSNFYILDIERFKAVKIKEYFDKILHLHNKWGFRKIRVEIVAAQAVIANELREYIRQNGVVLSIDEHKPNRHMGTKEERMAASLNPRYENLSVFHYQGGGCELLEEELVLQNPPHDDIKDTLAACLDICIAPSNSMSTAHRPRWEGLVNSRFGGVN